MQALGAICTHPRAVPRPRRRTPRHSRKHPGAGRRADTHLHLPPAGWRTPRHLPDGIGRGRGSLVPLLLHRRELAGDPDHPATARRTGRAPRRQACRSEGNPVEVLRDTVRALRTEPLDGLPPLTSGMVGFIGWEAVRHWEKLPNPPADDLHLPETRHEPGRGHGGARQHRRHPDADRQRHQLQRHRRRRRRRLRPRASPACTPCSRRSARPTDTQVSVLSGTDVPADELMNAVTHSWDEDSYRQAVLRGKEAIVDGRGLPGGHLPPLRTGIRRRSAGCLPDPARHQPQPVHVPVQPAGRPRQGLLDRRLLPGGPGHRQRRPCRHPPDRRLPPARGHLRGRPAAREEPAGRREGTRRAPDAGGPLAQRPLQGLRARLRRGHPVHGGRALQPHHAPGLQRGRQARTRHRRLRRARRDVPRRHALRRAQAPRPAPAGRARTATAAASTAAWSATSTSPATWTWPSPSAPHCSRATGLRAGRRRHRRRLGPGRRGPGNRQQVGRAAAAPSGRPGPWRRPRDGRRPKHEQGSTQDPRRGAPSATSCCWACSARSWRWPPAPGPGSTSSPRSAP